MGQFDHVFRENADQLFISLVQQMLNITVVTADELNDKLHTTTREVDFLKKITDIEGKEFILHLEFQTTNDSNMVYRMAEYKTLVQAKYQMPVRQLVIYMGNIPSTMETKLPEEQWITGYELIDIRDYPTEAALASQVPEEIILAILADYKKADTGRVIKQIIEKLQKATKGEAALQRAIEQLMILARLRKLEKKIEKQVKDMPITFDITTDRLYNRGRREGKREGIREGIREGKREGLEEGITKVAIAMIRTGESAEKTARLTGLSLRKVEELKRENK